MNRGDKRNKKICTYNFFPKSRKGSHIGIIASFTIFVMFLIGTYFVIDPMIRVQRDKQLTLNYLESELSKEFSDNLTIAIVSDPGTSSCLNISDSQVDVAAGGYAIAKKNDGSILDSNYISGMLNIGTNSETPVWVYYSPVEFYGNSGGPIYQEDADSTTCINNKLCDGDWSTYNDTTSGNPVYYFNYTVQSSGIGAVWRIKENLTGDQNGVIPDECWNIAINIGILELQVTNIKQGSTWRCLQGIYSGYYNWIPVFSEPLGQAIYEEAIWWQVNDGVPSECNVSEIESARNNKEFFEKEIIKGINDFETLKSGLNVPPGTEFSLSFEMENGTVLSAGEKDTSGDVYTREIPIQYIDYYANNLAGKLRIKTW